MRDPAIKLLGQTIQSPVYSSAGPIPPPSFYPPLIHHQLLDDDDDDKQDLTDEPVNDTNEEDGVQLTLLQEGSKVPSETCAGNGELESDDLDSEEGQQRDMNNPQEKTLKKPDKLLPCPRCNSMDTKFCYYNNYNLSQPRHFCKSCQRYWTAGGTMRNVPVGAGRRKSKYSAPHYQHFAVSEALQSARMDHSDASHHAALKTYGTVLTFGYDKPLCESVAPVMNICGKAMMNGSQSGTPRSEELRMGDNRDDHSCGSSITVANAKDEVGEPELQNPVLQNCNSFPPQFACYPGAPWPYPWNAGEWNSPVPQMAPPGFCPPGFPMAFYPTAPYWGCGVPVHGTWNVQWVMPESMSPNHAPPTKGLSTTKLGKHHRDENLPKSTESLDEDSSKESNPEKSLWVPKTLRIDDPGEAAKSSIWATLGIQNERAHLVSGDLFKAFNSKVNEKGQVFNPSSVLQANPAAMCRSQSFRESA